VSPVRGLRLRGIVRRILPLVIGVLLGQWLAWNAGPSPADFHARGLAAWERRDYAGALGSWSEGATLRPDDALLQYRRATALARLGQWEAATDAFRFVLLLEPPAALAQAARAGLADVRTAGPATPGRGRFLVDTGSSVTIVAPALAASVGLLRSVGAGGELQTVAGLTSGPAARLASLRVGEVELLDVPVVVHDPGPEMDGILGNSVLGRYHLILDGHRRLLHLRPSLPH